MTPSRTYVILALASEGKRSTSHGRKVSVMSNIAKTFTCDWKTKTFEGNGFDVQTVEFENGFRQINVFLYGNDYSGEDSALLDIISANSGDVDSYWWSDIIAKVAERVTAYYLAHDNADGALDALVELRRGYNHTR